LNFGLSFISTTDYGFGKVTTFVKNIVMKIQIINGPNLNLLGKRETDIYGDISFETYFGQLKMLFPQHEIQYYQSNIEGELVTKIQDAGFGCQGIVLNAGGYTHTSVAISDAVQAVPAPVIEVHLSNIFAREDYRHVSRIAPHSAGVISGFGLDVYRIAIIALGQLKL
jgi:3-dehydroquinate dehydratase II